MSSGEKVSAVQKLLLTQAVKLFIVNVLKLYEYMCVVSTMPIVSHSVSKNSQVGFGQLTDRVSMKNNRNKMSPLNQDKHNVAREHARITKDVTRDNFGSIMGNLPQINRKSPAKGPSTTQPSKKVKRKADVPNVAKSVRATQSLGPSGVATEASTKMIVADYSCATGNMSVTKGSKVNSKYPDYFFKPRENLFEGNRGSRYNTSKPQTFNLTQPDTNLAKFVFSTQQDFNKKSGNETQSLYNSPAGRGGLAASNVSINQRSPRSVISPAKNARTYLKSHHSLESDNTIQNFLMKNQCGKIIKTEQILAREQDRVEKVRRARENAIQIAMEKEAKLILKERKYESNTKRHEKLLDEESNYQKDKFHSLQQIRK